VHVYDSCSTDRTGAIAREHGALVTERAFDDWSTHQNWGLAHLPFRHPWVLYLDADERLSPELARSVRQAVQAPGDRVAFSIERRDIFLGRWLRHTQATARYVRLFRPAHLRYERLVNPVSVVNGPTGTLTGPLMHYPFSKGIGHWIERHNGYSRFEACQVLTERQSAQGPRLREALFAADLHVRRSHQKRFFQRLPMRPLLKFAVLYLARGGFLDGRAGLTYATLAAIYEYFIVLKVRELERHHRGWSGDRAN
jgi:glycosyltransferase involved in cell wall biosynthesis